MAAGAAEDVIFARWVQVVSRSAIGSTAPDRFEPVLVARAVVDGGGGRCPTVTVDTQTAAMVPRDVNDDPEGFPKSRGVRAVVMDTSAAKEVSAASAAAYQEQYESFESLLQGAESGWIITHVPIYAVTDVDDVDEVSSVNENLQTATHALALPRALELGLVGHRHIVQAVNTDEAHNAQLVPPHLIMGASGVNLSGKRLPRGSNSGRTRAGGGGTTKLSFWIERYHAHAEVRPGRGDVSRAIEIFDSAGTKRSVCDLRTQAQGWGTALECREAAP